VSNEGVAATVLREHAALSLDDLGHDADRDRPTHLFPVGFDRSSPAVSFCGARIRPPFRPNGSTPPRDICIVCASLCRWRRV
jgi:hypothetical protein